MNINNRIFHNITVVSLLSLVLIKINLAIASCNSDCKIEVSFLGSYLDQTCKLTINQATNNEAVLLPEISSSHLQQSDNEVGAVPFTVQMTDCPVQQRVMLTFESEDNSVDPLTGNLKNTLGDNMSKNVQVRIRKENGQQLRFNDLNSGQLYTLASGKNSESHQFTASYYSPLSGGVTPGKLIARATLNINYQ